MGPNEQSYLNLDWLISPLSHHDWIIFFMFSIFFCHKWNKEEKRKKLREKNRKKAKCTQNDVTSQNLCLTNRPQKINFLQLNYLDLTCLDHFDICAQNTLGQSKQFNYLTNQNHENFGQCSMFCTCLVFISPTVHFNQDQTKQKLSHPFKLLSASMQDKN